jgi:hypothetical protein
MFNFFKPLRVLQRTPREASPVAELQTLRLKRGNLATLDWDIRIGALDWDAQNHYALNWHVLDLYIPMQ